MATAGLTDSRGTTNRLAIDASIGWLVAYCTGLCMFWEFGTNGFGGLLIGEPGTVLVMALR